MRLFKSRVNGENYIERCEETFIQNLQDLIIENNSGLVDIDYKLQLKGLSLQKLLKKNNINSVVVGYDQQTSLFLFEFKNNVELIDILSFCDLVAKFSYETSENFYTSWRESRFGAYGFIDYNQLINNLLTHDLNGMYLIEDNQIVEQEGALKIRNEKINDSAKKLFLDYYNPICNHYTKKDTLRKISNLVEPLKTKLPKDKSQIYDKSLINSMNSFMEIVNTIDGIRHSNNRTQVLTVEHELQLMDIAINHAITLIKYEDI